MRIISGRFRSRKISTVSVATTRPTMDKVRGAIFNIIGPYFDGGVALDLFAGTGSMGLEGISRGMDFCYFVDNNYIPIKTINENISSLDVSKQTKVIKNDYLKALQFFKENNITFDYVFLDPPYCQNIIPDIVMYLIDNALLNNGGLIVAEYAKQLTLPIDLPIYREGVYGIRKVTIYEGSVTCA